MHEYLDTFASSAIGGGLATVMAKWLIGRSMSQLDSIVSRLSTIESRLSAMDVYMRDLPLLAEHDKKIVALETRLKAMHDQCRFCKHNTGLSS